MKTMQQIKRRKNKKKQKKKTKKKTKRASQVKRGDSNNSILEMEKKEALELKQMNQYRTG